MLYYIICFSPIACLQWYVWYHLTLLARFSWCPVFYTLAMLFQCTAVSLRQVLGLHTTVQCVCHPLHTLCL